MITTHLQHAIQRLDELPPPQQEEIARLIEAWLAPATVLPSYAGAMPDLPDDFEEELMRRRHEIPPAILMDEQLHDILKDDSE